MKSYIKQLGTIAMLSALGFGFASPANAYLANWYVDTDGAGGNAPVFVQNYLDLNGQSYIHNTISGTSFTFNKAGTFTTNLADSASDLIPSLKSTFTGSGTGSFVDGAFSFTSGVLTVKSGATTIGQFSLLTGSGLLNANSTLPNGTVSIIFKATSLLAGYFFDSGMNDLSTVVSNPEGLLFGFATTNVNDLSPQVVKAELASLYNATFDPDQIGPITSNQSTDLLIGNNGQFKLQVPEPGSLALVGIALLGFVGARRRKN